MRCTEGKGKTGQERIGKGKGSQEEMGGGRTGWVSVMVCCVWCVVKCVLCGVCVCVELCVCGVRHRVCSSLSVTHAEEGREGKGGVDCNVYRGGYSAVLSAVCGVLCCVQCDVLCCVLCCALCCVLCRAGR
jgi:hypothetical protein